MEMAVRGTNNGGFVAVGFTNGDFEMIGSDAVIGWVDGSGTLSVRVVALDFSSWMCQ